jgi:hypothetical protein
LIGRTGVQPRAREHKETENLEGTACRQHKVLRKTSCKLSDLLSQNMKITDKLLIFIDKTFTCFFVSGMMGFPEETHHRPEA